MKWIGLLSLTCLLAGCGDGGSYHDLGGANMSNRRTWTARGDLKDPSFAIDSNMNTAALSGADYTNTSLVIDLKQPCVFHTVIIEHGQSEMGFPRTVGVATSMDGVKFTERYQGPGTRKVTILLLPQPVLARYVRLQALRPGREPWSLAEVHLQ
jgi:hypothetical protein